MSNGEEYIGKYLLDNRIAFEKQKKFVDCKCNRTLRFDFYIPFINAVIEYQGIQHFKPIDFFGGEIALNDTKKRDDIKRKYCELHNINYFAISYLENIEVALNKILSNEDIVCPYGNIVG